MIMKSIFGIMQYISGEWQKVPSVPKGSIELKEPSYTTNLNVSQEPDRYLISSILKDMMSRSLEALGMVLWMVNGRRLSKWQYHKLFCISAKPHILSDKQIIKIMKFSVSQLTLKSKLYESYTMIEALSGTILNFINIGYIV